MIIKIQPCYSRILISIPFDSKKKWAFTVVQVQKTVLLARNNPKNWNLLHVLQIIHATMAILNVGWCSLSIGWSWTQRSSSGKFCHLSNSSLFWNLNDSILPSNSNNGTIVCSQKVAMMKGAPERVINRCTHCNLLSHLYCVLILVDGRLRWWCSTSYHSVPYQLLSRC